MSNNKASDEAIIAALLANGTKKAAASALGISEAAIYDRMRKSDFRALYSSAQADILRGAVAELGRSLTEAVKTVAEIMTNKENNPAIRLQAAQTILNNVAKLGGLVTATEDRAEGQRTSALFGIDF